MRQVYLLFFVTIFTVNSYGQAILLDETNNIYTQDFDSLEAPPIAEGTFLPNGWYMKEAGGSAVDNKYFTSLTTLTPSVFSLGDDTSTNQSLTNPNPSDRALGVFRHNTFLQLARVGAKITNVDATKAIGGLIVTYRSEVWYRQQPQISVPTPTDTFKFYYSVDADSFGDPNATWVNWADLNDAVDIAWDTVVTSPTAGSNFNYDGNTNYGNGTNYAIIIATIPFNTFNVAPGENIYVAWTMGQQQNDPSDIVALDDLNLTALYGPVSVGSVNNNKRDFRVTTSPNPAVDVLKVQTSYAKGNIMYTVSNTMGYVVKRGTFNATGVNGTYRLEVGDLAPGIYMARFMDADNRVVFENFVKQ